MENNTHKECVNQALKPTLRDQFAMAALQGELASTAGVESTKAMAEECVRLGREPLMHLAIICYEIADAMLEARKQ